MWSEHELQDDSKEGKEVEPEDDVDVPKEQVDDPHHFAFKCSLAELELEIFRVEILLCLVDVLAVPLANSWWHKFVDILQVSLLKMIICLVRCSCLKLK